MVYRRKPVCPVKRLGCCVPGQGHSERLKGQLMFAGTISSELLNLL